MKIKDGMDCMKEITQVQCDRCSRYTNHEIIAADEQKPNNGLYAYNLYEMLKCCGCSGVVLRHTFYAHANLTPTILYKRSRLAV
jgi:uncharacterized Zn finger protein